MIWYVRASPKCARRRPGSRVMSSPSKRIVPPSTEYSPVIKLNNVVLPAPFGPMMSRRSPVSTVKPRSEITDRPLNDFVTD